MTMISEALLLVNILWTSLLLVVIVYWLTVIVGALDVDFLNVDWDGDGNVNFDVDADAGADAATGEPAGWLRGLLSFFYVGEIPVMVLISLMLLTIWVVSMIGNYHLNPGRSLLIAPLVYLIAIAAGLLTVKVVGWPFSRLFAMLNREGQEQGKPIVGRLCVVQSSQVSAERLGQATVQSSGAPLLLNVKCLGHTVLKKGDEAIITSRDTEKDIYFVEPIDLEN